ncbi:MAG: sigma-70 family RNA polymerase sigma factor, partial [Actinobacteria bacterium]|nr:sigma-70 family RNA polymerase sigma factor [Actinomycetota bacterium]
DAADALQNTMLKALRALPGETRQIALKAWLYRIAHNESISLLRARRPDSDLDAAAHVGDPRTENLAESRERLRDLTADLSELTEKQRASLLMRELGGLEFSDVAGALQVTASAAKQSVYEARCVLQALEEGRAMDCDLVRRTLSDGDRRTLRAMKLRGHLRACAGCRDFEHALHRRPAQLAALAPPLPLAMAASILHGLLGAGGGHGGGGLLAALGVGGASLGTKVATVAVIASTAAGGAAITLPALDAPPPVGAATAPPTAAAVATAPRLSRTYAPTREADAEFVRATTARRTAGAGADRGAQAAASGLSRAELQRRAAAPPSVAARERAKTAATAKRNAAPGRQPTSAPRDRATERPQTQKPAPGAATTTPTTPRAPAIPTSPVAPTADGSAADGADTIAPPRPR